MKNNPLILLILMMTACSENFQEEKIELIVDQKIIIKEKINDSPIISESDGSNFFIRHKDDVGKIDLACEAAGFFSKSVVDNNNTYVSTSFSRLSPINSKNSIVKCSLFGDSDSLAGLGGCALLENTSNEKIQTQYFLNLKDHMEQRYGMKVSATLKRETLEKSEGSKRYLLEEVKISKDSIQCNYSISD